MTIVIPTWIVIILVILIIVRSYIRFKKMSKVMSGMRELLPDAKTFLDSKKTINITITKTITEKDEDTNIR